MWSEAGERYKTPIADIFSAENKLKLQLLVEAKLAGIQASLGIIPEEDALLIDQARANVSLSRVQEIESEIHHDLMSMVKALSEQSGKASGSVHLGATSNDIQDTVLALQLTEARNMVLDLLDELSSVLAELSLKYKDTATIGRTHGQFAVPTTVGFKFANFLYELQLAKSSLLKVPCDLSKFSGAIGNYASTMRSDIEIALIQELNLVPTVISTQVVPRVVHADYMNGLALCSSVIERISKEIRNLQRSEIREWFEPFGKKQVGSSAMPHKRNPHKSERISGLSRIIRANVLTSLENIALEHERDISHSSVERIIMPESLNILYYMTLQINSILNGIEINTEGIAKNLMKASGLAKSEQILKLLVDHVGRQEGHELLRKHANNVNFKEAVLGDEEILRHINKSKLEAIFGETNTGLSSEKVTQVLHEFNTTWKNYRN